MLVYLFMVLVTVNAIYNDPYNFHFSIGGDDFNSIYVSWSTKLPYSSKPIIKYGDLENNLDMVSYGTSEIYINNSVHHHVLINFPYDTKYYFYTAGDEYSMTSDIKKVYSPLLTKNNKPKIAIYGDMGIENVNDTIQILKSREYDLFIHIGDISYADDKGLEIGNNKNLYENTYDIFFKNVESFSNNTPYMVCPGNHDVTCHSITDLGCEDGFKNFGAFNSRFKMPSLESNGVKNMWYSFDFHNIHFISISTETDFDGSPTNPDTFFGGGSGGHFGNQIEWLINDLEKANKNRNKTPWIIVYGHRPMYDKNIFDWPFLTKYNIRKVFEPIFIKYNINIYFAGHIHAYERNYPIIDGEIDLQNGIYHIVCGSPGNQEKIDKGSLYNNKYTAFYNYNDYGFGELIIHNNSVLEWNFYTSKNGYVNDNVFIHNKLISIF